MKKNFILLTMATVAFLVVRTETTSKPAYPPEQKFQVCGKHLSALLAFVCQSKYNTPIPTRLRHTRSINRLETSSESTIIRRNAEDASKRVPRGFLSREEARSLLLVRRRRTTGVYDECCKKPCAYAEIVNYCAA